MKRDSAVASQDSTPHSGYLPSVFSAALYVNLLKDYYFTCIISAPFTDGTNEVGSLFRIK